MAVELEAALLRELRAVYQDINLTYFRRKLRAAAIELSDATSWLGRWHREVRAIEISRTLLFEKPWGIVVEVLKHEMAHQYVHEVLGKTDETAHGPAFRDVCRTAGIDASAAGLPGENGEVHHSEEDERILSRIAKLLALAQSPNANEAQSAMNAAQRLMLKHNLDAARDRMPRDYGFRHLGIPTGRVSEAERRLAAILSKHFFVEVIWVPVYRPLVQKRGSVLEICGTQANLEMASYVHAFLMHTAAELWAHHKRARGLRSNRDRRTFLSGVMAGFYEKLEAEREVNREQGLVWVRDADLTQYYRHRHPRIQHVQHAGSRRTEAHAEGRRAGRSIVLRRPIQAASTGGKKLLLPGGGKG
jgi:hypothetical protein